MENENSVMEKRFDSEPIFRLVIRLGISAMFAQFFNILYSIVDRIFVGHIAVGGETCLAAIGICAPALTAITAFVSLVGTGGAAMMSMSMGRKDKKTAQEAVNTAFITLIAIAAAVTAILLIFEKPLLYILGCSDALYPYASQYFKIYVLGTIAVLCGSGMNHFILGQGYSKQGMIAIIIGAAVNTVLDPIFIYVLNLGIAGAAAATITAQFCVLAYVLKFLSRKDIELRIQLGWSAKMFKRILSIGTLPFFIVLLDNLIVILLNTTIRKYAGDAYGDQLLSCTSVIQSFMVIVFYPAQGITSGCGTLYSYHFGAGNYQKVMSVFKYVFLLCAAYMSVLCVASQLIPEVFAGMFISEAETVSLAAECIQKYTLGILGVAVQYAIVDGLTAMGQIKFALPLTLFRKILYAVCVVVIPMFSALENIFWCATISDLVGACFTIIIFSTVVAPLLKKKMAKA